jgi:hypothetical protein
MESSRDKIKIFLDAFRLGDGSTRIRNDKYLKCQIEERSYFTSSKRMADQISELILKIGKRPSFYIQKTKDKKQKFLNGEYIINNDLYIIRECNSIYHSLYNMKYEEIEYNDLAYCVELEKNNTLYTMRNGRCIWSGNCKHTLTVVFRELLEKYGVENYK